MPFTRKKTLSELQEEIEYKDAELTLEQKNTILRKLKANNLSIKSFGSWQSAWQWVKTH